MPSSLPELDGGVLQGSSRKRSPGHHVFPRMLPRCHDNHNRRNESDFPLRQRPAPAVGLHDVQLLLWSEVCRWISGGDTGHARACPLPGLGSRHLWRWDRVEDCGICHARFRLDRLTHVPWYVTKID